MSWSRAGTLPVSESTAARLINKLAFSSLVRHFTTYAHAFTQRLLGSAGGS